jgi:multiple sugar transport system permease protein
MSSDRARTLRRDDGWAWLFIGPLMAGVVVFYFWPILSTFYNSFTTFGAFGGSEWAGLENYAQLVTDAEVPRAVLNTLLYTAVVLLGIPLAVYLASLLNRPGLRFAWFYRVMFFMPIVAMPAAIAMVWRMIYNSDFGLLNYLLSLVGIDGPYWISSPGWALAAVSIVGLWSSLGFAIIILSGGLRAIPPALYEAASLDGAGPTRQFLSITVPLLTPSIFFLTIITAINGFQLFDLLYALMGPSNPAMSRTQSLVYLFYEQAFAQNDKGYASAIAILILLIIGVITAVQFRFQKRWVNYE